MAKLKLPATDRLLGLVAMFVSLVTLIIFVRQTNFMEKESRLNVLPYLMLETSNNGQDNEFRIEIYNYGVGPGIIESRSVVYKGKEYDMEFPDFLAENFPQMDSINLINTSSVQPGLAIPAGQHRTVLVAGGTKSSYLNFLKLMEEMQAPENGFDYRINYKSIFDDRWVINALEQEPKAIE